MAAYGKGAEGLQAACYSRVATTTCKTIRFSQTASTIHQASPGLSVDLHRWLTQLHAQGELPGVTFVEFK
jgi:hypothetical protein